MKRAMEFIERIQEAPEPVKRRWIALVSAIMMIVVVFLWLKYFNALFIPAEGVEEGQTFWTTMKSGISVLGAMVKNFFAGIGGLFDSSREFMITPQ